MMLTGQPRKLPHNAVYHPKDKILMHPIRNALKQFVFRSAISSFDYMGGSPAGQHPLVYKFRKGYMES